MERWTDVVAIREVIDRYALGIDQRDWPAVRDLFTADCRTDYGRGNSWESREPFITWLDELHRDIGRTMHRMSNHVIEVAGDAATATSYLDALLSVEHRGNDLLNVVATYEDELVRTKNGWKISGRRTESFLWRRGSQRSL